ncbi:MAG TPA: FAD binding domain-containing protein [Candidatus Deferrimicrobium sp.]|nr:FAD binding domain-containing protein [Candidatus Deferrimicrobium sp.]
MLRCIVNDREVETDAPAGTVTLDFIREHLRLPGTKEGCREGECGACTILLGELKDNEVRYKAVASCLLPLGEVAGKHIVTVEGIAIPGPGDALTPVQQALTDEAASQCGFCTPGFVMSLTGFFLTSEALDYGDALDALDGNICRCTGYLPIRRAAQKLCAVLAPQLVKNKNRVQQLVEWHILPPYFNHIPERLTALKALKTLTASEATVPKNTGPTATNGNIIVAGATDLYVQKPGELLDKELLFISSRSDLSYIRQRNHMIYIGAGTTTEELKCSPLMNELFPNLKTYLNLVSSTIIRNRATLAGNIVNASPIGYLTVMLLALDTHLGLSKERTLREVPLKHFFKGYKLLDLEEGEIIRFLRFPVPAPPSGLRFHFHFEKVSQRKHLDIAACNTAIYLETEGYAIHKIRLSAGGVAPIPLYLAKTCAFLEGKEITTATLCDAAKIMTGEISPIDSVRGSAQYKTLLLRNLFFAHFITLFPEKDLAIDGKD